jgi:Biotin-requiring enzyme
MAMTSLCLSRGARRLPAVLLHKPATRCSLSTIAQASRLSAARSSVWVNKMSWEKSIVSALQPTKFRVCYFSSTSDNSPSTISTGVTTNDDKSANDAAKANETTEATSSDTATLSTSTGTTINITIEEVPADKDNGANSDKEDEEGKTVIDMSEFPIKVELRMPDMGMGSGKILEWYKQEGDLVKTDDVICDIETPDFTFGMESEDDYDTVMGEIIVQAPSGPVKDNDVICTMYHPEKKRKNKK